MLWGLKVKDCKFKANLGYRVKPYLGVGEDKKCLGYGICIQTAGQQLSLSFTIKDTGIACLDIRTSYLQIRSAHQILLESGDSLFSQRSSRTPTERGSGRVGVGLR